MTPAIDDACAKCTDEQWRGYVLKALDAGEKRMDSMDSKIDANTEKLESIDKNTSKFLEVFNAMEGGFKVLGWLGAGLKWITATITAFSLFWKMVTGRWPFL